MASRVVDVLVPVALDQTYSYRVPAGLELAPGDVVTVPLGARDWHRRGLGRERHPIRGLHNRLKDVDGKLDVPPLKPELRGFVDWVSDYTLGVARHGAAHGAAAWASNSAPAASASACGSPGRRRRGMTPARARVARAVRRRPGARQGRRRRTKRASAPA